MPTVISPSTSRSRAVAVGAAVALAAGALASWIVEAVAAGAWTRPAYDYATDKISYLGSPDCGPYNGQVVCSPRWVAIDVTWVVQGVLVAAAGVLIARMLTGRIAVAVAVVAVAEGIGFVLFAVLHDSTSTRAAGLLGLYYVGAALVIVAGNTLPILLGAVGRRLGIPRAVGVISIVLGAIGLVGAVATFGWLALGIAERLSVYTFLAWQLVFAAALVRRPRTRAGSTAT